MKIFEFKGREIINLFIDDIQGIKITKEHIELFKKLLVNSDVYDSSSWPKNKPVNLSLYPTKIIGKILDFCIDNGKPQYWKISVEDSIKEIMWDCSDCFTGVIYTFNNKYFGMKDIPVEVFNSCSLAIVPLYEGNFLNLNETVKEPLEIGV